MLSLSDLYVCQSHWYFRATFSIVGGHDSESRRWHTIAWESFCHPKKDMRMGLKHVHIFNKALVMKRG